MANYYLERTDKIRINFFIIRETYKYMAKIDKLKSPMSTFYRYLDIEPNLYDKIIETGICSAENGKMKNCVNNLIKCGFSDTLFRKDSPTLIKTSDLLLDEICEYLFTKRMSLEEFQKNISMYLGTIMNTDDTLLVLSTRKLIINAHSTSEPDDTIMDFIEAMETYEYDGHNLQKNILSDYIKNYKWYKQNKEAFENKK